MPEEVRENHRGFIRDLFTPDESDPLEQATAPQRRRAPNGKKAPASPVTLAGTSVARGIRYYWLGRVHEARDHLVEMSRKRNGHSRR